MGEYERQGISQYFQSVRLAVAKVRGQNFKFYIGALLPNCVDAIAKVAGAAIW
jgi:hypothetical protein